MLASVHGCLRKGCKGRAFSNHPALRGRIYRHSFSGAVAIYTPGHRHTKKSVHWPNTLVSLCVGTMQPVADLSNPSPSLPIHHHQTKPFITQRYCCLSWPCIYSYGILDCLVRANFCCWVPNCSSWLAAPELKKAGQMHHQVLVQARSQQRPGGTRGDR